MGSTNRSFSSDRSKFPRLEGEMVRNNLAGYLGQFSSSSTSMSLNAVAQQEQEPIESTPLQGWPPVAMIPYQASSLPPQPLPAGHGSSAAPHAAPMDANRSGPRLDAAAEPDPLFTEVTDFLNQILKSNPLPVQKDVFITIAEIPTPFTPCKLESEIEKLILKSYKDYRALLTEYFKAAYLLRKDAQVLQSGKIPAPLLQKSTVQFKKDIPEVFQNQQSQANQTKALEDLRRKVRATKEWLTVKSTQVAPEVPLRQLLGEIYDHLSQVSSTSTTANLVAIQLTVISQTRDNFKSTRAAIEKKFTQENQDKIDKLKKEAETTENYCKFVSEYPTVALACYYRDLEDRLLSVICASADKREAEYLKARKGHALSRLESEAYKYKEELQSKKLPFLDSKSSGFWKARKAKNKEKGKTENKERKEKKDKGGSQGKGRGRSTTRKNNQPSSRQGSQASSKGRSLSKGSKTPRSSRQSSAKTATSTRSSSRATSKISKSSTGSRNSKKSASSHRASSRNRGSSTSRLR